MKKTSRISRKKKKAIASRAGLTKEDAAQLTAGLVGIGVALIKNFWGWGLTDAGQPTPAADAPAIDNVQDTDAEILSSKIKSAD